MNFDTIRQRLVKSIEEGEAKLEAPGGVDNALTRSESGQRLDSLIYECASSSFLFKQCTSIFIGNN